MIFLSSRRKFFLTFVFIIIDAILLVSFFVIRDAAMLNQLKKEAEKMYEKDLTSDRFNTKLKTKGEYGIVEGAMKSYLDNYSLLLQETLQIVKDPEFTGILSYENYQNDGPEFQKSLAYLEEKKEWFNNNMDTLIKNSEEDTMQDYIYKRMDNKYYCDLFMELIQNDSMKSEFMDIRVLLEQSKVKINHIIDVSHETLTFLIQNKDNWVLEEGEIRFRSTDLYNQYLNYINQIKG